MWRLIAGIVGVASCVLGAVWVGQGTGAVHGSPMTGHAQWTYIGIVLLVVGIAALLAAIFRGRRGH